MKTWLWLRRVRRLAVDPTRAKKLETRREPEGKASDQSTGSDGILSHDTTPKGRARMTPLERISVVRSDIAELDVDAIVNAANSLLSGGGGVDGAIHRAAGPELLAECQLIDGCPTGSARLTKGYNLLATYVIHTVGPVYEVGLNGEPELLRSCYTESLKLAAEKRLDSIAFPCLSTGAYCYPSEEACAVAFEAAVSWLADHDFPRRIIFCCHGADDVRIYRKRLKLLGE